jgi:hypothetical protein
MSVEGKPNLRYDHAWAVIRLDGVKTGGELNQYHVTVMRVYWTREKAMREVARLNELNAAKDCFYYSTSTRIERRQSAATTGGI